MKHQQLRDVLAWADVGAPPGLVDRLEAFEQWLSTEGAAGGGIGAEEADAWVRHVLDSLMFARGLPKPPSTLIDLGSGVGLPGIPLALLFPTCEVISVDRAGRRLELARRAARVVGVPNLRTVLADFALFDGMGEAVVMRASLPPERAIPVLTRHIAPGGVAVLGIGLDLPSWLEGEVDRFPGSEVLDPGRWLHIMRG